MTTESFLSLIRILIVLFMMLMVGFYARKKGIIDTAASKKLSALIVNIGQPAMIMNPLFKVDFEKAAAMEGLTMFLIGMEYTFSAVCSRSSPQRRSRTPTSARFQSFL